MNEDFLDLLRIFLEAHVRFLVVGAHALAVHGVPRATSDLDVWVATEEDNAARVLAFLVGGQEAGSIRYTTLLAWLRSVARPLE